MNRPQGTVAKGFLSLSTRSVDNPVHVAWDDVREAVNSSLQSRMVKKASNGLTSLESMGYA
jgi:hypothetical protein